jgi:hypothetical protein
MLVLDSVTQILVQFIPASKLDSEVACQNLGLGVQMHMRIVFVHQKEVNGSTPRMLVCINKCTKNKKRKVMKSIQGFSFSFDSYFHFSLSGCVKVLHLQLTLSLSCINPCNPRKWCGLVICCVIRGSECITRLAPTIPLSCGDVATQPYFKRW